MHDETNVPERVAPEPTVEFDFEPPPPAPTTPRTRAVAAEFRLGDPSSRRGRKPKRAPPPAPPHRRRPTVPIALPAAGELTLLCGPSGSGKSSLLRALRRRARRAGVEVIDLHHLKLPRGRPVLDCFGDDASPDAIGDALRRLARVGLAEVWTWLRRPPQLSEGQRWRLRVALALRQAERAGGRAVVFCDEFAAVLDRLTAHVVAVTLRRAVATGAFAAVVATSHDDLESALAPTTVARCDFGRVRVEIRKGARDVR